MISKNNNNSHNNNLHNKLIQNHHKMTEKIKLMTELISMTIIKVNILRIYDSFFIFSHTEFYILILIYITYLIIKCP
jgi:hypothetical protein